MLVTLEADPLSVTYHCIGCTARVTFDTARAARVGASFVAAHRDCDETARAAVEAPTSAGPIEALLGNLPLV